jgi:hypothetical protein
MKKKTVIILSAILFIVLIIGVYFIFFYTHKCDTQGCFDSYQKECNRASYIIDQEDITLEYEILGKKENECAINVEVLKIKVGDLEKKELERKSMVCYNFIGNVNTPGEDLSRCNGPLKEKIQEMIIQKAHSLILSNLEEISTEFNPII